MIFRKNHCSQCEVETRGWNDSQYLEEYNIENMYKKKKMSGSAGTGAAAAPAASTEVEDAGTKRGRVDDGPNSNDVVLPTEQQVGQIIQMVKKQMNESPAVDLNAASTVGSASTGAVPPAAADAALGTDVKPPTPEELAAAQAKVDAAKTASEADATNDALKTALTNAEAELAALNAKAPPAAESKTVVGGRRRTKRKNGKKSHKKGKSSKKVAKRRKSRKSSSSRRRRSSRKQNKH